MINEFVFCRSRNLQCQRIFQVNSPVNAVCLHPNQVCYKEKETFECDREIFSQYKICNFC